MGSKAGIEKMRGRLIEQYGSIERYYEIQRERAAAGGGSKKRDPSTRAFSDVKIVKKASLLGHAKRWGSTEVERLKIQE